MTQSHESLLSAAPLEIRHRIYQQLLGVETHVFFDKGQLQMIPCQGADDVSHRRPGDDAMCKFDDPIWIRRVKSSWGCHWKCEETYLNGIGGSDQALHMPLLPLLLTSKTMFYDIVQFFSHPAQRIHFTDLETIDNLLSVTASSVQQSPNGGHRMTIFKSVRNIGLTLRASLRFLGTLYVPYISKTPREPEIPPRRLATPEGSGCLRQHEQWKRLWPSLLKLPYLQRFSFWLDHDEYYPWDLVYESEILQDLSDVMPGLTRRGVEVCVNLPRLPLDKKKRLGYHEGEYFDNNEPDFSLQRRIRLPWVYADDHVLMHHGGPGVKWANNGENGQIPPELPRDQISEPNDDFTMFDAMGWDMDSKEFEESYMGNQIIWGGNRP